MTRAELEFAIVVDQSVRRKEQFIARLNRWIKIKPGCMGTPCRIWQGSTRGGKYRGKYPCMNFYYMGACIMVDVHRVFLIMMLGRPIAEGMECGHLCHNSKCCVHVEEQTRQENLWARNNRYANAD